MTQSTVKVGIKSTIKVTFNVGNHMQIIVLPFLKRTGPTLANLQHELRDELDTSKTAYPSLPQNIKYIHHLPLIKHVRNS
jgi:hypothetical protein